MDKFMERAVVRSQISLADGVFSMWLKAPRIAALAKAGQFVNIYCNEASRLLPRPISICEADAAVGCIRLVYRVAGAGTKEFSGLKPGASIDVLGPLGNGFIAASGIPENTSRVMLIGGGIGIPPMVGLAACLRSVFACADTGKGKEVRPAKDILPAKQACSVQGIANQGGAYLVPHVDIVLGFRDEVFLIDDFAGMGNIYTATEDGSCGIKGTVLDAIRANGLKADIIYACGPMPMLRAVKAYASDNSASAWLSLEERMACGVGACLGCVVQTEHTDEHSNVRNRRVCADGPVFNASEVII